MKLIDAIPQAYLHDEDIEKTNIKIPFKMHLPVLQRKEVIQTLLNELSSLISSFPKFNHDIWHSMFDSSLLDIIIIIPVLGTKQHQVDKENENYVIYLDLFLIADTTRIVSQMFYILHNYLTFEITRICLHQTFTLHTKSYSDILDYSCFINGLANYLSWGEACDQYKFDTDKYEPYKEKAFSLLAQSRDIIDKALQHKILMHIHNASFWDQFTSISGMFYFDDTFRSYGVNGIKCLYEKGPNNFIHSIFES